MNEYERIAAEPFKPHQCMHWSDGRRCRAYALHNEYFCVRHRVDPVINIVPSEPFSLPPFLTDRAQIQAALGEVLTRLAARTIDDKRARLLLYTLQSALANLKAPNRRIPHTLDGSTLLRRRRRLRSFRWQPAPLASPQEPAILSEGASAPELKDLVSETKEPAQSASPLEIAPGLSPVTGAAADYPALRSSSTSSSMSESVPARDRILVSAVPAVPASAS